MVEGANVTSIDAIQRFRTRLIDFSEEAQLAMSQADFDIQRTIGWLKHDRMMHWKHEIKRRRKELDIAKSELFRKQLESKDTRTSAIEERKALQRAERRMTEAEEKSRAVSKWIRRLDRDVALYKGATSQINSLIQADLPKAASLLEMYVEQLQEYLRLNAPSVEPRRNRLAQSEASTETESDASESSSSEKGSSS